MGTSAAGVWGGEGSWLRRGRFWWEWESSGLGCGGCGSGSTGCLGQSRKPELSDPALGKRGWVHYRLRGFGSAGLLPGGLQVMEGGGPAARAESGTSVKTKGSHSLGK